VISLKFPRASILLHPSIVALITWLMVVLLYSLHLSLLLLFPTREAIQLAFVIVLPVFAVSLVYKLLQPGNPGGDATYVVHQELALPIIQRRIRQCLWLWVALSVIETVVSGGVPILWLLTGSGKVNFDYGISSVHGMVNALFLAIAVTSFALYLYTDNRRHLRFPVFAFAWSIILVSRGTLFVLLIEYSIIYLRLRKIRGKTLIRLVAIALIAVMVFGYVGDFRSGGEAFRSLAQPTDNFPDWAPSGLLWAYIYITTPINNLLLSTHTLRPTYNPLLPATAATLFPTVLRNVIYGKQAAGEAISGALESEALNVSTAYVGPFQDMGSIGIVGFSIIAALFCEIYWHRIGFRNIFVFAVFTQALMLSLFYNMLFSLPILGQLVWFYYFTMPKRGNVAKAKIPRLSHSL
jgi:oligosaccharide repeat unit polymerase